MQRILDDVLTGANALVTSVYGLTLLFSVSLLDKIPEVAATASGLGLFLVGGVQAYKMVADR